MIASDTIVPAAFDCVGCGRAMRVLTSPEPPADRVCNLCRFMPGWPRVPAMRAAVRIDGDAHDPEKETSQ